MKILALEKEVPGVVESQFTEEILRAEAANIGLNGWNTSANYNTTGGIGFVA